MDTRGQPPTVVSLDDPQATELASTGGKGANLARLLGEGFPVPEGVCVTTAVYGRLVDGDETASLIAALEGADPGEDGELREAAARVRDRIRNRPIPVEVRDALEEFLEVGEPYVVRSSATAEDLPSASFAGQHGTVLDVSGLEAVLDAVSECMASLFTDRAVSYRVNNAIDHGDVAMAVVVQRMVDADVSGVLFTADPLTGKRTVASVDAVTGLGDAAVSGTVTADNARVDRKTGEILEYRTGDTEAGSDVERTVTDATSATRTGDTEAGSDGDDDRVLSDDQVLALVSYGERIEEVFGTPQDVEWSLVEDEVVVLQSRPITSLFPVPTPVPEDEGLHVYYSYSHRQGMTDPMPPLSVDYVRRYTTWTLQTLFAYDPPTFTPAAGAGGLVYLDVTPMLRSKRLAPKWLSGVEEVDEPGAALQREVRDARGDEFTSTSALGDGSLRTYPGVAWAFLRLGCLGVARTLQGLLTPRYDTFPERSRLWYEGYVDRTVASIRAGDTEAERIRRTMDETSTFGRVATRQFVTGAGFLSRYVLERLCPGCEEEFEALDKGLRGNVTVAMVLELGDVADLARDDPAVAEALERGAGLDEIRELDGSEEFVAAFERFLDVYGHRAAAELDPSRPRYREDPSPLLGTVRSKLASEHAGEHRERFDRLEAEAEEAVRELERVADRGILGPVRRRLVGPLAARYRSYKSTRETPKYAYTYLWAEFRRQVLGAGERLEREGAIDSVDDVWLFRLDELLSVLDGPDGATEVDLDERRSASHVHRGLRAPRVITSDGQIPRADPSTESSGSGLVGVATSGGVAEGPARVVSDPRTDRLEDGEILVCPYTDPGWTPLFLNAAGLVSDVGGVFSHGSLVAREYGIPSVVIDDATARIETGQLVRVDGDRGVVEILGDGS